MPADGAHLHAMTAGRPRPGGVGAAAVAAAVVAAALVASACTGSPGDGGTAAPGTTRAPLGPTAGRAGETNGADLPDDLKAALAVPVDAVRDNDADRYWTVLTSACRAYHGDLDNWRAYFARMRAAAVGMLNLMGDPSNGFATVAVDLPGTWVAVSGDRARVRLRVATVDGHLVVDPDATNPVLWKREGGAWKTTDCLFESEHPFDADGNLSLGGPAGTVAVP